MDIAYDQIQEEALSPEEAVTAPTKPEGTSLNNELKEAYQAISATPWGARLGGFFGSVKKQGESYYEGARKELSTASAEASKGISDLISNTNVLPISTNSTTTTTTSDPAAPSTARSVPPTAPDSLPADIVKEAELILSRFKIESAARLQQIKAAEDAADEALFKFGSNIRNFLRDAVTVSAPADSSPDGRGSAGEVLFESKDADGRRVVHATRFDAQLHAIHSTPSSFTTDPASDEYAAWTAGFDVDGKTEAIAKDLKEYEELRRAMERLVPEQVEYGVFWTRYYFLRHVVEAQEQMRKELLAQTQQEEEVGWGDEEDEEEDSVTPSNGKEEKEVEGKEAMGEGVVEEPAKVEHKEAKDAEAAKAGEPRRSNEHSVSGSDASYDVVSGAQSRTPGSPTHEREVAAKTTGTVKEESDEEDWE